MGIQGLLPFLKEATDQVNIKKYAGYTVAVDTYCWMHKGAFACAMQLATGQKTDVYVKYVLKYVNMMRANNVRPILVFDGHNLPSKKAVEKTRRDRRQLNLNKGKQFLRENRLSEARECFGKCINITPEMAHNVIRAARQLGVDCIVAPYEADAQLAYLCKLGIAQAVITEDSDLVVFGCRRVVLKMDLGGNGLEIARCRLSRVPGLGKGYSPDRFRHMCITAGCDYLPSLSGIGIKKACKLFQLAKNPNVLHVVRRMDSYLKMNLSVPKEYVEEFERANNTFLHQVVFDPLLRKQVPLHQYPPELQGAQLTYAGSFLPDHQACQLALGNLSLYKLETIDNFLPDHHKSPSSTSQKRPPPHQLSIWSRGYRPLGNLDQVDLTAADDISRREETSTRGTEVTVQSSGMHAAAPASCPKRAAASKRPLEDSSQEPSDQQLLDMYSAPPKTRRAERAAPAPAATPTTSQRPPPVGGVPRRPTSHVRHRLSSRQRARVMTQGNTSSYFSAVQMTTSSVETVELEEATVTQADRSRCSSDPGEEEVAAEVADSPGLLPLSPVIHRPLNFTPVDCMAAEEGGAASAAKSMASSSLARLEQFSYRKSALTLLGARRGQRSPGDGADAVLTVADIDGETDDDRGPLDGSGGSGGGSQKSRGGGAFQWSQATPQVLQNQPPVDPPRNRFKLLRQPSPGSLSRSLAVDPGQGLGSGSSPRPLGAAAGSGEAATAAVPVTERSPQSSQHSEDSFRRASQVKVVPPGNKSKAKNVQRPSTALASVRSKFTLGKCKAPGLSKKRSRSATAATASAANAKKVNNENKQQRKLSDMFKKYERPKPEVYSRASKQTLSPSKDNDNNVPEGATPEPLDFSSTSLQSCKRNLLLPTL